MSLAGIEPVGFRIKSDLRNQMLRNRTTVTAVVRLRNGYADHSSGPQAVLVDLLLALNGACQCPELTKARAPA